MTRSEKNTLTVAAGALALFLTGVGALFFCLSRPEPDVGKEQATLRCRVQSRSMEPALSGPRFLWTCPECGAVCATSLDVDLPAVNLETSEESGNENSPEAIAFRNEARYTVCTKCGYDLVPASGAVFQDGDVVEGLDDPEVRLNRWDVALFRDASGRPVIKRAVGLPGERVSIMHGDVFINGVPARRSLELLRATSAKVEPCLTSRTDSRAQIERVLYARDHDGAQRVAAAPVTNESPVPCWNGSNAAPVEFVRDFILKFDWYAGDGQPVKFTILARRPRRVWAIEYDEFQRRVDVSSLPLYGGRTELGRSFENLETIDFANAEKTRFSLETPSLTEAEEESAGLGFSARKIEAFAVDGELILTADGVECARVETGDQSETEPGGTSAPFAVLGDAGRIWNPELRRDLHYSTPPGLAAETLVPEGEVFALGDNSPASRDSRFSAVGTLAVERVLRVSPEGAPGQDIAD